MVPASPPAGPWKGRASRNVSPDDRARSWPRRLLLLIVGLVLPVLALLPATPPPARAQGAPRFDFFDMGAAMGNNSFFSGINNAGACTGGSDTAGGERVAVRVPNFRSG